MAGKTITQGSQLKVFANSFVDNNRQYQAGNVSSQSQDYFNIESARWADTLYVIPSGYPVKLTVGGTAAASSAGESRIPSAVAPTFDGTKTTFYTDATVSAFAISNGGAAAVPGGDVGVNGAQNPDIKIARRGSRATIFVPWTGSTTVNTLLDSVVVGWDDSQLGGAGALTDTSPVALTNIRVKNIYPGLVPSITSNVVTWVAGYVAEIII